MPARAIGYLQHYTPIANCCQADDNQNCMLLIWVASWVYSASSLRFLFSTDRNKIAEKSTSSLKWDGLLLTQVVPLRFCLHFLGCEKGLRRDEGSGLWRWLAWTRLVLNVKRVLPAEGLLARGLCLTWSEEWIKFSQVEVILLA